MMLSWHLGELSEEVSAGLFTEKKFSAGGSYFSWGKCPAECLGEIV